MPGDSRVEKSDYWAGIRIDDAGRGKNLAGDSMHLRGNCKSRNIAMALDNLTSDG